MKVVKRIFFILLMINLLINVKSYAATGTINTEGARIRREPNTASDILTIAYNGESIELIEKTDNWYKIKYGEYTGYLREDLINVVEDIQVKQEEPQPVQENTKQPENIENIENKKEFKEKVLNKDTQGRIVPSLSASKIVQIKSGTKVTVIQVVNNWTCIQYEGKSVWVLNSSLSDISTQEPSSEVIKVGYVDVTSYMNVREEPNTSSNVITTLNRNTEVYILEELESWYKIKLDNNFGYVSKSLISDTKLENVSRSMEETRTIPVVKEKVVENEKVEEQPIKEEEAVIPNTTPEVVQEQSTNNNISKGEEIVAYAKQYLGYSYVYGGSGPSSFDCSGFTMYVFKHFGVNLAHSVTRQSSSGTYVEKANLQPGDIIIFRDWDNQDLGHVGIYIGDTRFIHAANPSRGVVTDTIASGYYYERYVSARRLY